METPFGVVDGIGPVNRVIDWRAHWLHLANTVERLCGSEPISADVSF